MIVLTVHSFNGAPSDGRSAMFDELGGTIGRADTNQLVLPDPERSISRVHAQVVFRNGGYALVDRGSNAVLINGRPVGNGREAPLRDGDRVQIGGYELGVSIGQRTTTKSDPFADLFGETLSQPATPQGTAPAVRQVTAPPPFDPFARPAEPAPSPAAAPAPDPFADTAPLAHFDPFGSSPSASVAPAGRSTAPIPVPASGSAIPDDWDPFAADAPAAASVAVPTTAAHTPLIPDLPLSGPSHESSLDALFGLDGSSALSDPLARAGLGLPVAQPNTAGDADPFAALLGGAPLAPPPVSDHVSELKTPWTAAPLVEQGAQALPARTGATDRPAPPAAPPAPEGAVLSWEQPSREARVVAQGPGTSPSVRPATNASAPSASSAALPPVPILASPPPVQPVAAARAGAESAAEGDVLLNAFCEGLGVQPPPLQQLGPDEMRLLGRLLRESAQGTVELLLSRAALKREMRAEVTVIAARENNPLKFSPSAEVALQYLLGVPKTGFMAPEQAMRDAYDDLRAHQLGMMAGMRNALEGVLQRFDPAVLEGQITRRTGLSAMLPGSRKAQLWEQFQALYSQLSQEATDDFHQLFGKAFLAAYESYIEQLHSQR